LQPPLWRQLQLTAAALASIRAGTSGSVAFEAVEPALRPGVQALGFQVLRWLGRAEALRRAMLAMIDKGKPHEAHPAYWAPFVVVGEGGSAAR